MAHEYAFSYVESDRDMEDYLGLLRAIWPGEGIDAMVERLLGGLPGMTRRNLSLLRHEGKLIATLNFIPQSWSMEGTPLKVAEMGMVATLPEYRNRGVQRILNAEFDRRLREDGYHLAVIEGIPYFYRQFGYEYTIPLDVETVFPLGNLPEVKHGYGISPLKSEEITQAMKLLKRSQAKFNMRGERSREVWEHQERTGWQNDWTFQSHAVRAGKDLVAYFRAGVRFGRVNLVEVSEADHGVNAVILGFLKEKGELYGATELMCRVSHEEPFMKHLASLGADLHPSYAWQIKVVDHLRLFQQLKPLFEKRLADSSFRRITEKLTMNFFRFSIILDVVEGKVDGVSVGPGAQRGDIRFNPTVFTKLLTGARSLAELRAEYPDISVAAKYRDLVDTLFPRAPSFIHPVD